MGWSEPTIYKQSLLVKIYKTHWMHLLLSNSIHLQAVQVLSLYTPWSARQLRGYQRLYCFCCLVLCTEAAITNCFHDLMLILGQNKASLVRLQQACRWCLAWFRFIIFLHNPVGTITWSPLYNTPLCTPILPRVVQYSQSEARFPVILSRCSWLFASVRLAILEQHCAFNGDR